MKMINDDSGVAYGYAAILIAVVFAGVLWVALSGPANHITEDMNEQVLAGEVSEKTASTYDWSIRVFTWILPLAILGSIGLWGITRSNLRGEQ